MHQDYSQLYKDDKTASINEAWGLLIRYLM